MNDDIIEQLFAMAREARPRAYAPYSQFRVAAALRGADGRIYAGVNVENAAYPQSQCAEASAIGVMIAAGCTEIAEILVLSDHAVSPCGGCRQRLSEFAKAPVVVHMADAGGVRARMTMGELLPHGFGAAQLGK